jgi:hypothetical protein
MNPLVVISLIELAQRIGMKVMEKKQQKPIEEWTDVDALKWLDDYEDGIADTDEILGPPEEDQ